MGPKDLVEACGVQHTVHPAPELLARVRMDLLEDRVPFPTPGSVTTGALRSANRTVAADTAPPSPVALESDRPHPWLRAIGYGRG